MSAHNAAPGALGGRPGSSDIDGSGGSLARWSRRENETTLRELHDQASALGRAAFFDGQGRRSPIWRQRRIARGQLLELQARIITEFAVPRSWRLAGRPFTVGQLTAGPACSCFPHECIERRHGTYWSVLDHGTYFRLPDPPYRPASVVSHLYVQNGSITAIAECRAIAERCGLRFEMLPWSWYNPGRCIAVLFTRETPR